jgi:hypothetical protein
MGDLAVANFRAYEMRLVDGELSRAERNAVMEWCLKHKEGGEAKYEEGE